MFTGIVTDIGRIESFEDRGDLRIRIACAIDPATIGLGASIACSGVCLTVVDKGEGWIAADVSAETQRKTASGMWQAGRRLNLERPLKVGDELGGHIVTGHVDGVARILEAEPEGGSVRLDFEAGAELAPFIAEKGSIAVDGVSLTVNRVGAGPDGAVRFAVNLIPHSAGNTTLGELAAGACVNVEIDLLARYLQRLVETRAAV